MNISKHVLSINLLEMTSDHSVLGRLIQWVTTYGRYILIGTEIVVLLAFISRFSLDRKITDLKEEIGQKQAVIEANIDLESSVKQIQNRLITIEDLYSQEVVPFGAYSDIISSLPYDTIFTSYNYSKKSIMVQASSGTIQGFAQFIRNLQTRSGFKQIEIQNIKKNTQNKIEYSLIITI